MMNMSDQLVAIGIDTGMERTEEVNL